MLFQLFAALGGVIILALVWWRLMRSGPLGSRTARQERFQPHDCPDDGFTVGAMAHPLKLDGSGKTLWVFDGLYCERCGRELGCARCGKVPEAGAVVEEQALADALSCCDRPTYLTRPGGRNFGPDPSGPSDPKKDMLN